MRRFYGPRRLVPSSLRGHLKSNGEAKRCYDTEVAAEKAALRHHKLHYACATCGAWHLGGHP